MATKNPESLASRLGLDRLAEEAQGFGQAFADKGVSSLTDRVDGLTDKLAGGTAGGPAAKTKVKAVKNMAKGDSKPKAAVKAGAGGVADTVKEGASSMKDKIAGAVGGGGQNKGKGLKVTNIVEELDLPVSRDIAYQAWTQFEDFPGFMKKVENVEQKSDEEIEWKAQIFWSHRSWTAKITEQVPNEKIVWESSGEKGHVDGAVTFHELAPDLTRMLVVLEYHPQGFFEHTGNIWRAQGRRVRLELKHFRRHVATKVLLHPEEVEGWEGEIHDGKVAKKTSSQNSGGSKKASSNGDNASRRGAKASASSSSRGAKKTTKSASTSSSAPRKTSKSSTPRKTSKSTGSGSSASAPSRARKTAKSTSSNRSSGSGSARKTAKKSSSRSRS